MQRLHISRDRDGCTGGVEETASANGVGCFVAAAPIFRNSVMRVRRLDTLSFICAGCCCVCTKPFTLSRAGIALRIIHRWNKAGTSKPTSGADDIARMR